MRTSPVTRLLPLGLLTLGLLTLLTSAPAAATPPTPARLEADRAVRSATFSAQQLLALLDRTRTAGQHETATCLDQKLSQVNSFARTLAARRDRLREAESRLDPASAAHERLVIRSLATQLRRIGREGRACVLAPSSVDGRTVVTVVVDGDVPDEDVSLFTEDERRRRP